VISYILFELWLKQIRLDLNQGNRKKLIFHDNKYF
jgi:hypothetical protein